MKIAKTPRYKLEIQKLDESNRCKEQSMSLLQYYNRMIKRNPKVIFYRKKRSMLLLFEFHDYINALEDFNFLLSHSKEGTNTYLYYRSICHFNLGNDELALKDIEIRLDESPTPGIFRYRGLIFESCENFPEAIHAYSEMIKLVPSDPVGYFLRGKIFSDLSKSTADLSKAIQDFSTAISLAKDNSECHKQLGIAYLLKHDFDKAISTFERAIDILPTSESEEIFYELGKIFHVKGKYDRALESYRQALIIAPENENYNLSIGHLYFELGDFKNAIKFLKKAEILNPRNCSTRYYLGEVFIKNKEYLEAITEFKKIISICPHCENSRTRISICIFNAYLQMDDEENALAIIDDTLMDFPQSEYLQSFVLGCKKMLFRLKIEVISRINNPFFQAVAKVRFACDDTGLFQEFFELVRKFWESLKIEKIDTNYLFQYTSMNVLENVLVHGRLRLTPVDYLNDPLEGLSLKKMMLELKPAEMEYNSTKEIIEKVFDTESQLIVFVRSLTSLEDSLQMWDSSYAQNGEGVSIGINTNLLLEGTGFNGFGKNVFEQNCDDSNKQGNPFGLYKIHYIKSDDEELKTICTSFFKVIEHYQNEIRNDPNLIDSLFLLISTIRYLLKNGCFSHEEEYRLAYFSMIDKKDKKIVSTFNSGLYIEMDQTIFNNFQKGKIVVGPKVSNERYFKIKHHMLLRDNSISIKKSDISFR